MEEDLPLIIFISTRAITSYGTDGRLEIHWVEALSILLSSNITCSTAEQAIIIIAIRWNPILIIRVVLSRCLPS